MKKNNMESKTLNETLDLKIDGDLHARLESLKALGLDPELFGEFNERINNILGETPEVQEIVESEIEKASIGVEQLLSDYNSTFNEILKAGSENEDYIEGEVFAKLDLPNTSANDDENLDDLEDVA